MVTRSVAVVLLTACAASFSAAEGLYRMAVIGDYGMDNAAEAAVARLVSDWSPSEIITAGDNNYNAGANTTIDPNIGQFWHQWISPYHGTYGSGSVDKINHFFPAPGNHDWFWLDPNGVTATMGPYTSYFTSLPGNRRYYQWTLTLPVDTFPAGANTIDFFALDSDSHEPDGNNASSAQAAWLASAMTASCAAMRVVYMHHPPYTSGTGGAPNMRWAYADWGADVVFAGHDHLYERALPPTGSARTIPYFVNGLGGASITSWSPTPQAGSQVRFNGDFGAQRMTFTYDATAGLAMTLEFFTTNSTLIDSATITPNAAYVMPAGCPSTGGGGGNKLTGGAIAVIVLIVIAAVGAVFAGVWVWRRRRNAGQSGAHFQFDDQPVAQTV